MLIIRVFNMLSLLLFNSTSWLGVFDALGRASSQRILSSGRSLRLGLSLRHCDDVIEESSEESRLCSSLFIRRDLELVIYYVRRLAYTKAFRKSTVWSVFRRNINSNKVNEWLCVVKDKG